MSEFVDTKNTSQKKKNKIIDLAMRMVKEKPLGTFGFIIIFILFFTGIFADYLAPYGENELTGAYLSPPTGKNLLGTDNIGRDLFSRIIFGARISMIVGISAASLSLIISITLGMLGGFVSGKLDLIIQRFVDSWMCFPSLVILITILSATGPGIVPVILVLSLNYGISGSRVVRSAVMAIRQNVYIDAAKAIGVPLTTTLRRHILPNIMAPIIILFTVRMPYIILDEAALSFLGFGIPPPTPSWGGMISGAGRSYMFLAPWIAIWPGVALSLSVYGINMFGDALRDLLDPRLRGGVGRYSGTRVNKLRRKMQLIKTK